MRKPGFSHNSPCGETHPEGHNISQIDVFVYLKNNYAASCWTFCTVVGVVANASLQGLASLPPPPAVREKKNN